MPTPHAYRHSFALSEDGDRQFGRGVKCLADNTWWLKDVLLVSRLKERSEPTPQEYVGNAIQENPFVPWK